MGAFLLLILGTGLLLNGSLLVYASVYVGRYGFDTSAGLSVGLGSALFGLFFIGIGYAVAKERAPLLLGFAAMLGGTVVMLAMLVIRESYGWENETTWWSILVLVGVVPTVAGLLVLYAYLFVSTVRSTSRTSAGGAEQGNVPPVAGDDGDRHPPPGSAPVG